MESEIKILGLGKQKETPQSCWFSATKYEDGDIQEITDPSGSTATKQITSIPSPFARIDLVKTAFREVAILVTKEKKLEKLEGNTIYHKMVSDALDIGEILFNKNTLDKIKIITWNKEKDLMQALLPSESNGEGSSLEDSHKLLGETLKLFLDQDKETYNFDALENMYIVVYDDTEIIGGTSPATLFFATANKVGVDIKFGNDKMLDDEYQPLYKRDEDYQKYLYSLFKAYPSLVKKMDELYKYLLKNLEYLKKVNPNLYKECSKINEGLTLDQFHEAFENLPVDKQDGDSIKVLGLDLKQKKQSKTIVSDFKIKIDEGKKINGELPLVLQNGFTKKGYRYDLHDWVATTKVPSKDDAPMYERQLPGQNRIYPYITISDFLEDYIIKLAYPLNNDSFFDGNMLFGTDDHTGCLLPIKKEFFDYFSIETLLEKSFNGKPFLEMKSNAGGGISVKLRIPIEKGDNEYIELERAYYPSAKTEISKPKINERSKAGDIVPDRGTIVELQFGVNVFPFVKQAENSHYRVMLLDRDVKKLTEHNEYTLNFYTDRGETALADDASTRERSVRRRNSKKEGDGQNVDFYILENEFDYIEVITKIDGAKGMIIPKLKEAREGTDNFTFAVDFGTTNTHIEYNINGGLTESFDIKEEEKQVITLNDKSGQRTGLTAALSLAINHLFIPEFIGEQEEHHFPVRTAIASVKGMPDKEHALADFNMAFFYEKEKQRNTTVVQTDLKWSEITSKDILIQERDEQVVRSYFENIIFPIRNKVLINAGNLKETSLIWFYPASMSRPRIDKLKELWKEVYQKYITSMKEPLYMCESTAPFYYYQKQTKITINDGPVVTIDIGGGTTDIAVFTEMNRAALITSAKFGANVIFGDGYERSVGFSESNGFIQKFKSSIEDKLKTKQQLSEVLEQMMVKSTSQDIIAFYFSLEHNNSLTKEGKNISFNKMLKNSTEFKIVFALYYAAIIYHIAKLLKAKGIAAPAHIVFSGTGSKIVNILASMECLTDFTEVIFKKVYEGGTPVGEISLRQDEKPKHVTSKGGAIKNQVERTITDIQNVLLGDRLVSKDTPFSYQEYENDKDGQNKVLKEVDDFIELFFELNTVFNFNENFEIEARNLPKYKGIIKERLESFLKEGYGQKVEELGGDKSRNIEESLFFYPLTGVLNNLAFKVLDI
jgi:5'-deoxynucleotidase YfbR-like HD superfamily hydrolase